jgi:hypothetical protein
MTSIKSHGGESAGSQSTGERFRLALKQIAEESDTFACTKNKIIIQTMACDTGEKNINLLKAMYSQKLMKLASSNEMRQLTKLF